MLRSRNKNKKYILLLCINMAVICNNIKPFVFFCKSILQKKSINCIIFLDFTKSNKNERGKFMFCEKCGTQLPDNAAFCTKCGASTVNGAKASEKVEEKISDTEVQLNVKPTFKFGYILL